MTSSRDRFVLNEGTRLVPDTMLVVARLSYQDAGVYTCEGRSTNQSDEISPWESATFELQLCCKLLQYTDNYMYNHTHTWPINSGTTVK